jgi:hypothetical protein
MHKDELISRLKMLIDFYRGVPEQKKEYQKLLNMLKYDYQLNKNIYSKNDIDEINLIKDKISKYSNMLPYKIEKPNELKKGAMVYHKEKYYVGVIDDTTEMRELFEDFNDIVEYRVRIFDKIIKIASPNNLIIIGMAYTNHCYKCKSYVGYTLERCTSCTWYICNNCGACGCQYHGNI